MDRYENVKRKLFQEADASQILHSEIEVHENQIEVHENKIEVQENYFLRIINTEEAVDNTANELDKLRAENQ